MTESAIERLARMEVLMDEARGDIAEGFAELRRKLDRLDTRVRKTEDAIHSLPQHVWVRLGCVDGLGATTTTARIRQCHRRGPPPEYPSAH